MVNYKKFITLLLIFSVYMMPFNTQAAGFGAWTITNTVAQGASTILTGSKDVILNGAKKIATGTAKITPTAAQVSKVLARGSAGYALSVAVEQLLGAVDWVLDPANNRINYVDPTAVSPAQQSCIDLAIEMFGSTHSFVKKTKYITSGDLKGKCVVDGFGVIGESKTTDTSVPDQTKSIPLEVVAAQVISNAESGDTNAQVATTAAAADIINDAQNDNTKARPIINQLENTQSIPTDQTAQGDAVPKDDTANPSSSPATSVPPMDISLDFPVFCDWAPSVCQAAKEVISLPITLTNWWDSATTSISESWTWAKSRYEAAVTSISEFFSEETNTDTELEFNDPTDDITDTTISFSDQCPAPITLADFNYHGITQKWEMNFSPWCDVISTFIKPIVIAMASFSAVLIVSGVRENG
ncbi:virulence factor TspB C-terminal domain-related protein [Acinetobacter colistiniresistens]|uniref:virulence factor TspB C-terminal domain-related protein n=1 Tax=Acinetobacter colistiniresistens TaxID=280145 RepID=UPI000DD061B4|nr:virulence factor TspB C-terminal domain-related protein [Acinetobacter colistiniresistens]